MLLLYATDGSLIGSLTGTSRKTRTADRDAVIDVRLAAKPGDVAKRGSAECPTQH